MKKGLMKAEKRTPDYVFEAGWEVCNKVGGIYTVLSTHAKTLQETICPNLIFIGPDFEMIPSNPLTQNPLFTEDRSLYADWLKAAAGEGLRVRAGVGTSPDSPWRFSWTSPPSIR